MACTAEYIDFVCSQLKGVGEIQIKKVREDWCIYVDEKPVILAFDNLCYVKMHPVIEPLMHGAWTSYPYDGAIEHYVLIIEDSNGARNVVKTLLPVTPNQKIEDFCPTK